MKMQVRTPVMFNGAHREVGAVLEVTDPQQAKALLPYAEVLPTEMPSHGATALVAEPEGQPDQEPDGDPETTHPALPDAEVAATSEPKKPIKSNGR